MSSPETSGRCCWPAQAWSAEHGRCEGPPSCPSGLVAEGDQCVLPLLAFPTPAAYGAASAAPSDVTLSAARAIAPPSEPIVLAWSETPDLDRALVNPRVIRGTDELLVIAGLVTFAGGYLLGAGLAGIDEGARNCTDFSSGFFGSVSCGTWEFAFIPVVGTMIAGFSEDLPSGSRNNTWLGWMGLPVAAVQGFGLVLAAIALFGYTEELAPGGRAAPVSFAPYATDHEGGAWLAVRF